MADSRGELQIRVTVQTRSWKFTIFLLSFWMILSETQLSQMVGVGILAKLKLSSYYGIFLFFGSWGPEIISYSEVA